ncbi:MAG: ComEC/Rec2 family competence protein [Candidatus Anstonellales archaeon]
MKYITLVLVGLLLFAGCIDLGPKPTSKENKTQPDGGNQVVIVKENESREEEEETFYPPAGEYSANPNDVFRMYFFNVGYDKKQGEAILVQKGNFDMLIDTGPAETTDKLINLLYPKVDDIEVLVLTNGIEGNVGGAKRIMDYFRVGEVWWNGNEEDEKVVEAINYAKSKGIATKIVQRPDAFSYAGMNVEIMQPGEEDKNLASIPDRGLVLRFKDRNSCFMTTSTILAAGQANLVDKYTNKLQCDVFQVPGFSEGWSITGTLLTSTGGQLITQVSPKIGVFTGSTYDPDNSRETLRIYLDLKHSEVYEAYDYTNGFVVEYDGQEYNVRSVG